jgi:hypothetical protein
MLALRLQVETDVLLAVRGLPLREIWQLSNILVLHSMIEKTWMILLVTSCCVFNSLLHSEFVAGIGERERQRLSVGLIFDFSLIFRDHSFIKLRPPSMILMHSPPVARRAISSLRCPMMRNFRILHMRSRFPYHTTRPMSHERY